MKKTRMNMAQHEDNSIQAKEEGTTGGGYDNRIPATNKKRRALYRRYGNHVAYTKLDRVK
jgi:hypothetical protein